MSKKENIEKLINNRVEKLLSLDDIRKALSYRVSIFVYDELKDMLSYEELFLDHPNIIILYQINDEYTGHWVTLINYEDYIEYFDSYGNPVDHYITEEKYNVCQNDPYLTELLAGSGKTVVESGYKMQKLQTGINTCGRWSVLRAMLDEYTIDRFIDLFKKTKNSKDWLVTALTFFI